MESLSFKGYLKGDDGENDEVRRFLVENQVAEGSQATFGSLKAKLELVFPSLKGKHFRITWQDVDNDHVTIACDEELQIALAEMTGPVYKINIAMVRGPTGLTAGAGRQVEQGEAHVGVVCDGCNGPVCGHRYKCMVCMDYDLCSQCEFKGIHPGHNMMRLTSGQGPLPNNFFKRLQKMQERVVKRQMCREKGEAENEAEEPRLRRHGGPLGRRGNGGGCTRPTGPLGAMLQGWMGTGSPDSAEIHRQASEQASEDHKAIHEAVHKAAEAKAAEASNSAAYLKSVGDCVAVALDPFGVEVDVSIESPNTIKAKTSTSSSSTCSQASQKVSEEKGMSQENIIATPNADRPEDSNKYKDDAGNPADCDEELENKTSTRSQRSSASPTKKVDEDDWQMVPGSSPKETTSSNTLFVDERGNIYPKLPEQPSTSAEQDVASTISDEPAKDNTPHDPKIQVALQAMMNMGFTNEGGWLSSLLEAKQGDIGKVLDVLQPVRK